ncbi:hypothetical protein CBL_01129 [Carabus blaptoides fortunei]
MSEIEIPQPLSSVTEHKRETSWWLCASFGEKLERQDAGYDVDATAGVTVVYTTYVCQRKYHATVAQKQEEEEGLKANKVKRSLLNETAKFPRFPFRSVTLEWERSQAQWALRTSCLKHKTTPDNKQSSLKELADNTLPS